MAQNVMRQCHVSVWQCDTKCRADGDCSLREVSGLDSVIGAGMQTLHWGCTNLFVGMKRNLSFHDGRADKQDLKTKGFAAVQMQNILTIEECTAHQWWPFWKAGSHTFHPWSCAWPSADKLLPRARAVFGHSYACIPILPRRVYLQSQCWQCQATFRYMSSSPNMMHSSRVRKSAEPHGKPLFIYAKITCKEAVSCAQLFCSLLFDHYWRFCLDLIAFFGNGHMRPKYHIWHIWPYLACLGAYMSAPDMVKWGVPEIMMMIIGCIVVIVAMTMMMYIS